MKPAKAFEFESNYFSTPRVSPWILVLILTSVALLPMRTNAQTFWTKYPGPVLERDTVLANFPNDLIAMSDPWVLKFGTTYKMWYTCGGLNYPADTELRSRICLCESSDGINWTKNASNPVLDVSYNGAWDSLGVETVSVLIDSAAPAMERYKMWYAGQYFNAYRYDIGYATSPDGVQWTKHGSPVLQVGSPTAWDGGFLEGPSVLFDQGIYKMWYTGYDLTNGKVNTGYATSPDGISWTKYAGNPVISIGTPGTWDSYTVQDPHVLKIGNQFHMWYGGQDQDSIYGQQTGYATSFDGIVWTKSPQNPVLLKGTAGDWDANIASFPSVMLDQGEWKLWYTGKDVDPPPAGSLDYYWELGYATGTFNSVPEIESTWNSISFAPNPAYDRIQIQLDEGLNTGSCKVFNTMGVAVLQVEFTAESLLDLDLRELRPGVYIVLISNDSKQVAGTFACY